MSPILVVRAQMVQIDVQTLNIRNLQLFTVYLKARCTLRSSGHFYIMIFDC